MRRRTRFTEDDLRYAFMSGFYYSGEGWNGEWPFNHPGRPTVAEAGKLDTQCDLVMVEIATSAVLK